MKPKIKRLRRKTRMLANVTKIDEQAEKAKQVANSMVRHIQAHPRYAIVLASIREAIPATEIALWFGKEGWLTISEKSFIEYIRAFKKRYPDLCSGNEDDYIDNIVDAKRPNIDPLTELNRLYRLQKLRLKIDVGTEQSMGKLFSTTVKEIEEARKLLDSMMAELGGSPAFGGDFSVGGDTRDSLRALQQDEGARDRMSALVGELGKSLHVRKETA